MFARIIFARTNQRTVERVAAGIRLIRQPGQVGGNRLQRLRMRAKTNQLRMVRVPASQTPQNLLRQQGFAPACRRRFRDGRWSLMSANSVASRGQGRGARAAARTSGQLVSYHCIVIVC